MTKLSEELKERLERRGEPAKLARIAGVTPSSVTGWMNGKASPDFESCLGIAEYLGENPERVFEKAERHQYQIFYRALLKRVRKIDQQDTKRSPLHRGLHDQLQTILDAGPEAEAAIRWNVESIYERVTGGRSPTKEDSPARRPARDGAR